MTGTHASFPQYDGPAFSGTFLWAVYRHGKDKKCYDGCPVLELLSVNGLALCATISSTKSMHQSHTRVMRTLFTFMLLCPHHLTLFLSNGHCKMILLSQKHLMCKSKAPYCLLNKWGDCIFKCGHTRRYFKNNWQLISCIKRIIISKHFLFY